MTIDVDLGCKATKQTSKTLRLGVYICSIGDVGPTKFARMMIRVDHDLLYGKVKFDSLCI